MREPEPRGWYKVVCVFKNGGWSESVAGSRLDTWKPWREWSTVPGAAVILKGRTRYYVLFSTPRMCKVYSDLESAKVAVMLKT